MNRSYGTRKLLYSLIANSVNSDSKAGGDGGGGVILWKIFSRGVILRHAV